MNYWVLMAKSSDGAIIDAMPEGFPTNWKMHAGEQLSRQFRAGGKVAFSDHFPDRRKLYDFVENTQGLVIASPKVRQILEKLVIENMEFLPVIVCDHQWRPVAEDYSVLNVLGSQDAIDMERSKYRLSAINQEISRMKSLVLQKDKITPPHIDLFRTKNMMELILMSDRVHDTLSKEGVTGFKAPPAEGFNDWLT